MSDSFYHRLFGGKMPGATPDSASPLPASSSSLEGHGKSQTQTSVPPIVVQSSNQRHNNGISPFVSSPRTRRPPPPPISNPAFLEVPRPFRPHSRRSVPQDSSPSPPRRRPCFRKIDLSVTGPVGPIHPLRMHPVRFISSATTAITPAIGSSETESSSGDFSPSPSHPGSSTRHIPPSVTGPLHPLRKHSANITSSPTMPSTPSISRPESGSSSANLGRPHPMPSTARGLTSSTTMPVIPTIPAIARLGTGSSSDGLSHPRPMPVNARLTLEDEIQQRIDKILAANTALKPKFPPAPASETPAPDTPSFGRRLLKKMQSVPDLSARLFSKSKNKGEQKPRQPVTMRHMHMTGALAPLPLHEHPGPNSNALTRSAGTDSPAYPSRSTRLPTEFESRPWAHSEKASIAPTPSPDVMLSGPSRPATSHHHHPVRPSDFGVFARDNDNDSNEGNQKSPTKPPTPAPTPITNTRTPKFAPVSVSVSVIGRQPPPFPSHDTPHTGNSAARHPSPFRDAPGRVRASPSMPATAPVVWAGTSSSVSVRALPALPSLPSLPSSLLPPPPPHIVSARRRAHNALVRKRHPTPGLEELERMGREVREQLLLGTEVDGVGTASGVGGSGDGSGSYCGVMVVDDGAAKGSAAGSGGGGDAALSLGGGTFGQGVGLEGLGEGGMEGEVEAEATSSREVSWVGSRRKGQGGWDDEGGGSSGEEGEGEVEGGLWPRPGDFKMVIGRWGKRG